MIEFCQTRSLKGVAKLFEFWKTPLKINMDSPSSNHYFSMLYLRIEGEKEATKHESQRSVDLFWLQMWRDIV